MTKRAVHVFSSKDLSYKTTISLKGIWPKVLVFDPFRKRVYCSNWISKNISVIDINTHKELYRIKTYGVPRGMVLSKNGRFLYVAQFSIKIKYDNKGKILKINLDKNKIVKKFGINGSKRHLALDKKNRLYVSDIHSSRIEIYDAHNGRLIKALKVFNNPNTIVLSKDEKYLYISCRGPNNPVNYKWKGSKFGRILLLNTQSLKVAEVIETGNQPTGLAISHGGKYLVTSDFLDNRIRVYKIKR